MRHVIAKGLRETDGSYRLLLALYNMPSDDYKRFLGFLSQYECHVPFRPFRMARANTSARVEREPGARRA